MQKDAPMTLVILWPLHSSYRGWWSPTGDQFVLNLLTATKSLVRSIWKQIRDESNDKETSEFLTALRTNAHSSQSAYPREPIALVYLFTRTLDGLVPKYIVEKNKDDIYEVMDELSSIITEFNGASSSYSQRKCAEYSCVFLCNMGLVDESLRSKLNTLVGKWDSLYRYWSASVLLVLWFLLYFLITSSTNQSIARSINQAPSIVICGQGTCLLHAHTPQRRHG